MRLAADEIDLEGRFWSRVERRGAKECWPWTGSTQHQGYGRIEIRSRGMLAEEWTQHQDWCIGAVGIRDECDCGYREFEAALAALNAAIEKEVPSES